MDVVVGTAGHIDHGKTALVKALTGVDADRLPDEKRRGITIDLGFAKTSEGDVHFGFVDVPGHERFVRNMLAGATGIDLVLLVVAADEGVMPQTREHFEICRLLGLKHGVIALTKVDLVDDETLELARLDVAELVAGSFLDDVPVVPVSSKDGRGLEQLRAELALAAKDIELSEDRFVPFLPTDRSFSIKGFGTVVTGTLHSGEIAEGDELLLLPTEHHVRVRGVQSHGRSEKKVAAGRRVAVNLAGVDHDQIKRGMVLTERGVLSTTQLLDCEIEMLADAPRPLRSRQRVRVHVGTAEVLARVQVLNDAAEIPSDACDFVQLRLESPVAALPGQRCILRSYSPQATIGGGAILDIAPQKHRRRDVPNARKLLARLVDPQQPDVFISASQFGLTFGDLQARTGVRAAILRDALAGNDDIIAASGRYVARDVFDRLKRDALASVEAFHKREALAPGISREKLKAAAGRIPVDLFDAVLASLASDRKIVTAGDILRLASHEASLSPDERRFTDELMSIYRRAKLEVPRLDEALAAAAQDSRLSDADKRKLLQRLVTSGALVKVTDEFYFAREARDAVIAGLREYAASTPDRLIDVPNFKELTGVSRKYAIPLLEYFDANRVTARAGDKRIVI